VVGSGALGLLGFMFLDTNRPDCEADPLLLSSPLGESFPMRVRSKCIALGNFTPFIPFVR
jgi:hypothetical protein